MSRGQASVSIVGRMAEVAAEARKTFDETDTDSEAYKRALMDWYRNRQKNSKRGSLNRLEKANDELIAAAGRLERQAAHMIACTGQTDARLAAIEMNLRDLLRETTTK